jgi:hypothetical protein
MRRMNSPRVRLLLATLVVSNASAHGAPQSTAPAAPPTASTPSPPDTGRAEATNQVRSIQAMLDAITVLRGLKLPQQPAIVLLDDAAYAAACAADLHAKAADFVTTPGWHGPSAEALPPPPEACDQVLAFYDPHDRRVVIRRSTYERDRNKQRMVVSHELEHAIVGCALPRPPRPHGLDEATALGALEEGDATVTALAYALSLGGRTLASYIPEALRSIAADEPKKIHTPGFFAYSLGMRFVLELYQRGGFTAVNDAFAHPPTSTSEILHVERYRQPRRAPNLSTRMPVPSPFTPLYSDSRGELVLREVLAYCVAPERAMSLAADWQADRITVAQAATRTLTRWIVAWRSEVAAQTYEEAINHCLRMLGTRVARKGTITVSVEGLEDGSAAAKYASEVLADVLSLQP